MHKPLYPTACIIIIVTIIITNVPFTTVKRKCDEVVYMGDMLVEHGLTLMARDSLQEAAHAFEQALDYYPDFSMIHYYLAHVYRRQGKNGEAEAQYSQAIQLDLEFYPAYYGFAKLMRDEGEHARAISLLETTLVLNPYYLDAYNELARLYIETGDFAAAERVYQLLRAVEEHTAE